MIHIEQLTPDTMLFHVRGQLNAQVATELRVSVFRSYHLGFQTFLCNLSPAILLDEGAFTQIAQIGERLRDKGRTWRVIGPPTSMGGQLILRTTLQQLPHECWN